MHILLISSSPRLKESNTLRLAAEILNGAAEAGADHATAHLIETNIGFCRHCEQCHQKAMKCPLKDDAADILTNMLKADGIILASPNYINQITGSLKVLLDRTSHFIHCSRLMGKYIVGVVTSGSGMNQDVLDYMQHYAHVCGAQYSGGVSARVPITESNLQEAFNLGKKLVSDIENQPEYIDQLKKIEQFRNHFKRVIETRKDDWVEEFEYWREQGWI